MSILPTLHPPQIAQQLTLDVEQYLSDNMPYYPWADQVLSFSNYDIQILDVCPDTNSVLALLCVLLQTSKAPRTVCLCHICHTVKPRYNGPKSN